MTVDPSVAAPGAARRGTPSVTTTTTTTDRPDPSPTVAADAPGATGTRGPSWTPAWWPTPIWSRRVALGVFVVYLVVAGVWLIASFGDKHWFVGDDWGFLVDRSLSDPVGWFTPQNTHWSTVPIVIYLALFKVFGLNTYTPYMAVVVVAHLALAGLLRVVMRRCGVGPWIATIVAGAFVLYGTGQQNIVFAIQISMVTSMICGVGHLVLADHDGPFDRRDLLGLVVGAIGVMASGVGPPLVVMVGVAVLLRRGWRLAFVHTAPLATLYLLWFAWQRPLDQGSGDLSGNLGAISSFVRSAAVGVFEGLGQSTVAAVALAVVLVAGLALAWVGLDRADLRRQASVPVALVLGAVLVVGVAGSQRYALGEEFARSSRYLAMATALVLPALAVAIAAMVARWWFAAPLALVPLLAGIPGNVAAFSEPEQANAVRYRAQQEFLLGAVESPFFDEVGRDVLPYPGEGVHQVTVGFLVDSRATGKIPEPPPLDDKTREKIDTRLTLSQGAFGEVLPGAECRTLTEPLVIEPRAGDRFEIGSGVSIARDLGDGSFSSATGYATTWTGRVLTAQVDGQRYRITPAGSAPSFVWCTAP